MEEILLWLVPFIAIGFVIAILVKKEDYHRPRFSTPASHGSYSASPLPDHTDLTYRLYAQMKPPHHGKRRKTVN